MCRKYQIHSKELKQRKTATKEAIETKKIINNQPHACITIIMNITGERSAFNRSKVKEKQQKI